MEHSRKRNLKFILSNYKQSIIILFLTASLIPLSPLVNFRDFQFMGIEVYSYSFPLLLVTVGFLLAIVSFLNKYLDKPVSVINMDTGYDNLSDEILQRIDKQSIERKNVISEIESLKKGLEILSKRKENEKLSLLSDEEKQELIESLKNSISSIATNEYLDEVKEKLVKTADKSTAYRLEKHFFGTMKRLSNEINELGRRAKVNLIIGSVAALSGVSVFILFVFERVSPDSVETYLITNFAPRVALVIVIEVFAYFFLGLYKSNLSEIKYFHNELTNVESKYLALEEAIAAADEDTQKEIVKEISKTERNFLLKKGESTVSTEEKRLALEENRNTIQNLGNSIGRNRSA